jgi:hypothetical protein
LRIAQARLIPSYVEVPLQTSSIITNDFSVELWRILATSCISTMKVDCPKNRLSLAQTLENILSVNGICASLAGTNEPICAINIISAF